jgi:subtilisin family serine protease
MSDPTAPVPEAPRPAPFDPRRLARQVITLPLAQLLEREPDALHSVVIDLNTDYVGGRDKAWERVLTILRKVLGDVQVIDTKANEKLPAKGRWCRLQFSQYVVVNGVTRKEVQDIVDADIPPAEKSDPTHLAAGAPAPPRRSARAVYRIWPNFRMSVKTTKSVATVKADAAHSAFSAFGEGIVWAVVDSGIDGGHPHFKRYKNLEFASALHRSFIGGDPLTDAFGHGTHVAGIIAGAAQVVPADVPAGAAAPQVRPAVAATLLRPDPAQDGSDAAELIPVDTIAGMAPRTNLVSLQILDDSGGGTFADVLAAIEHVQEVNAYGRTRKIHGVNLSAGYPFDPAWFACGQSPLCVEIDRLVRSGVVVVVAAGNDGYGLVSIYDAVNKQVAQSKTAGLGYTINDPGNADLAITVGSTHRESPHVFGISYFSSKGPTGDGRLKPDLVAPGERIISCAANNSRTRANVEAMFSAPVIFDYVEDSGTSMAAPHVSGVIAAFLSVRREYIGLPEQVKEILLRTAVDLKRERYFQGAGLVDLMRALQE